MQTSLGFMLAFGGVIFFMFMALTVPVAQNSSQKRLLKARLRKLSAEDANNVSQLITEAKLNKLSPLAQWIETQALFAPLRQLIMHAGLHKSVLNVISQSLALMLACLVILVLVGFTAFPGPLLIVVSALIPVFRLIVTRNRRLAQIEEQLPEALDMMKRALQVGHPFTKTLHVVAEEMGGPLGNEFGLAYVDINYGASVESALNALVERVPSISLTALVTTVAIQRESGGSLAETLDKISDTIRGRFQFQRQLKTLTAESRLSAWVLGFAPFVLFVIMYTLNPESMSKLTSTPEGHDLLIKGLVGILLGCLWMRKIIQGVSK